MEKQTVLAAIKNYVSSDWGRCNPDIAHKLSMLTESDLYISEAPEIIPCYYEYVSTARGEANDMYFPLTKQFKTPTYYLYAGDEFAAIKDLVVLFGKDFYDTKVVSTSIDNEDWVIDKCLRADAENKFRSEFALYNGFVDPTAIRIDEYERYDYNHRDGHFCSIYALTPTPQEPNKRILLGYIETRDDKEQVLFDIEGQSTQKNTADKKDYQKLLGCLLIGIGIFFPPVLIAYLVYLYVNKKK